MLVTLTANTRRFGAGVFLSEPLLISLLLLGTVDNMSRWLAAFAPSCETATDRKEPKGSLVPLPLPPAWEASSRGFHDYSFRGGTVNRHRQRSPGLLQSLCSAASLPLPWTWHAYHTFAMYTAPSVQWQCGSTHTVTAVLLKSRKLADHY